MRAEEHEAADPHSGDDAGCVHSGVPRRALLGMGAVLGAGAVVGASRAGAASNLRHAPVSAEAWRGTHVVLLGTAGGPLPTMGRSMPAQAVVVNGRSYLVDCGSGVVRQMVDARLPPSSLSGLFLTHLHGDHVNDYFGAVTAGYPQQPFRGGYDRPVLVYGPGRGGGTASSGTADLNAGILKAYASTVRLHYPALRALVLAHDITMPATASTTSSAPDMDPVLVHLDDQVRVTAILVKHTFPSFAFRFDTADGSVVFSGDTVPTPNLLKLARGTDVLVHEVMDAQAMRDHGTNEAAVQILLAAHTDVTQVGKVADQAGAGRLVLSHFVPLNPATPYSPTQPEGKWITPIRRDYAGPIMMGRDLMRLRVGSRRR